MTLLLLLLLIRLDPADRAPEFRFEHSFIDLDLTGHGYAQTAVADIDRDGTPDFITGRQFGEIYWYRRESDGQWTRHLLGRDSPSDVGACAMDVDGDGWIDIVTGGSWFRNSRDPRNTPFEQIVFDAELDDVHDVVAADIDRDGRTEIITMSDQNDLRFYKIPADPTQPWDRHYIGPSVHGGTAVADIDGDGDPDVVRSDEWFENLRGDGSEWEEHEIGPTSPAGATGLWTDGTRALCHDINRDGKMDVVLSNAEIKDAKIWWAENVDGKGRQWKRHDLPTSDPAARGAYHSLKAVDFDGDGIEEIFTCEMEWVPGDRPPRFFIWHNPDGRGEKWLEHVILDKKLGGHEAVIADFDGDGRLDIVSKPWAAAETNGVEGRMHVDFLRNVKPQRDR